MNTLSTLATYSLLGTDRRPPQWPVHEGPLGGLLGSLERTAPEKALLQTAGILGTCHLAGWKPPSVPDTAVPCPPDTRPHVLPSPFKEAVAGILADGPVRLQAEVFMKLATAGYNLPHRSLPQALNGARSSKTLRPFLLPVLGSRGTWLAAQNEHWNYASGGSEDVLDIQVWEQGSLEQRKFFLTRLRAQDAARARELVATAMTTEAARERNAFIECLATGLSLEDEDLLEATLKDKSKETRQAAAALLSMLPQSRYAQRMIARLQPWLTMEKKFLRGTVITLEPPAAYVAEWKSDLIEEVPPQHGKLGARAWWLHQIVSSMPLEWWEEYTSLSPDELIAWVQKTDWRDALLLGWATALTRQKKASWADAFLTAQLPFELSLGQTALLETLPLPQREKHFLRLFEAAIQSQYASSTLDRFLASMPVDSPPLSQETASQLLKALKKYVNSGSARQDWQLRNSLVELACVLAPGLFSEAASGWDLAKEEVQSFAEAIARLSTVLDQRQQLQCLKPIS